MVGEETFGYMQHPESAIVNTAEPKVTFALVRQMGWQTVWAWQDYWEVWVMYCQSRTYQYENLPLKGAEELLARHFPKWQAPTIHKYTLVYMGLVEATGLPLRDVVCIPIGKAYAARAKLNTLPSKQRDDLVIELARYGHRARNADSPDRKVLEHAVQEDRSHIASIYPHRIRQKIPGAFPGNSVREPLHRYFLDDLRELARAVVDAQNSFWVVLYRYWAGRGSVREGVVFRAVEELLAAEVLKIKQNAIRKRILTYHRMVTASGLPIERVVAAPIGYLQNKLSRKLPGMTQGEVRSRILYGEAPKPDPADPIYQLAVEHLRNGTHPNCQKSGV